MDELHALAESLGVHVEYADLTHLNRDGDCNIDTRTIRLQSGMLERLERCVCAHEIAHFMRGDRRNLFGFYDDRDERRADEWAAHHLIDITEYRIAEAKYGTNLEYIGQELNVMEYIVEAFEGTLDRIGGTVYMNGRMGAGQWSRKFAVA